MFKAFERTPEQIAIYKKYGCRVPRREDICGFCKSFNYTGKGQEESLAHLNSCLEKEFPGCLPNFQQVDKTEAKEENQIMEKVEEAPGTSLSPVKIEEPSMQLVPYKGYANSSARQIEYLKQVNERLSKENYYIREELRLWQDFVFKFSPDHGNYKGNIRLMVRTQQRYHETNEHYAQDVLPKVANKL